MAINGHNGPTVLSPNARDPNYPASRIISTIPPSTPHEMSESTSDDADDLIDAHNNISGEDAESLIGPAMSTVATHLKSPKTPALEKRYALEDGGRYVESRPVTPTLGDLPLRGDLPERHAVFLPLPKGRDDLPPGQEPLRRVSRPSRGLSLGALLSPSAPESPTTSWYPSSKPVGQSSDAQSSLQGVFGGPTRNRSFSNSADALKKFLPKGLPSMAQVGNLFASSSTGPQRLEASLTFPKVSDHRLPPTHPSRTFEAIAPPIELRKTAGIQSPTLLRRSTSDDSLLYHSLSRASSLGDDTRFENQHDQVNSRVKAIRDSLQDRSSFRLPQMPSMPSMPSMPNMPSMPSMPRFNISTNLFYPYNTALRWSCDTDKYPDILPGTTTRKRPVSISNPSAGPGIAAAAVSNPRVAAEIAQPVADGSHTSPLDRAIESLTGDVVMMGGYRGSILRSTKTKRQVWVPVKVGLNMRKVNLEVGLEPEDEERMSESIYASGMLQNIGPVDISRRLFKRLSECENARNGKLRIWDYGYDWRLSPHLLSKRLTTFLEGLPSNQPGAGREKGALVIAHSLGGLITRHVVNQRPELFSGVIYAGVPQSCVNILGPIRNGDAVLLSSRVLTAQVNFTLRTSFVLLPEDGECFVDINTKEKYPVDFFDLDQWIKYRWSPCTDPPLPPRNQATGLGSILNLSGSLLSLPLSGRKSTFGPNSPHSSAPPSRTSIDDENRDPQQPLSKTTRAADSLHDADRGSDRTIAPQIGQNINPVNKGQSINSSVSTAVTLPRDKAITYLRRTLAETKKFKQELHFRPELEQLNKYPPLAVIYGKSIPTCCGAKVDGREGIPCADSYDNLAFASGDGVCLAKEAMLPEGYKAAYGGRIRSDRGHVTLLGDLNAVGRAIEAVLKVRGKGIGLGLPEGS